MLEDLRETGNLRELRNLLISVKAYLHGRCKNQEFIVYKFIGDGWILLFPRRVHGVYLMELLTGLSKRFRERYEASVAPRLHEKPRVVGLTFGIDEGRLVRFEMTGRVEFIGRALNIASRLQSAIKDKDHNPSYKALVSKHVYQEMRLDGEGYRTKKVTRRLRNIHGGRKRSYIKVMLPV